MSTAQTAQSTQQPHAGMGSSSQIRFSSGQLKETRINICSYEMYEMEMLDRSLISLQRTEEAYIDINNRIIENVNKRKDRLNTINNRMLNLSSKIIALYSVNSAMRIQSAAQFPIIDSKKSEQHHPYTSMFFDNAEITRQNNAELNQQQLQQQKQDFPELSSLRLDKKLFNNRLQNEPENLKKIVSGVTKDINDISNLLLSLESYRSTVSDFKHSVSSKVGAAGPASNLDHQSEGLLGSVPQCVESIADLMLFDSDINVYGDSNVYIPEFDFKTRTTKKVNPKEKKL